MPQTHILLMNEDGKYYEDKRTYCGLDRYRNSYGYTSGPLYNNDNDYYCHFCFNGYREDKLMPKDQMNAQDKLLEMGSVDAASVIKAVEKRIPQPHQRSRMFATLVAEERRKDAKAESAQNLMYWLEDYKGRQVEIPSKQITGIMTDAKRVPDTKLVMIVIDGQVHTMYGDEAAWVWPRTHENCGEPVVETTLLEAAKAVDRFVEAAELLKYYPGQDTNSFVRMTMSGLFENKEQYRGYRVDFEDGPDGIFTDAWTYPGRSNWYVVVVDGVMEAIEVKTAIAIHMPRKPRQVVEKKCYVKFTVDQLFMLRRSYYGHAIRHDGDIVDIGIFTDMTEVNRKYKATEYIVVVDGQIIHFASDAVVWLEL